MADIRKNLTLSAQLDDSQLRKQLEILKKEMGKTFNVDAGSLNDLKSSIRDIAKEFGSQLRKELEGIRGARGKAISAQQAPKTDMGGSSDIGSFQVREMQVINMTVNTLAIKGISKNGTAGLGTPVGGAGEGDEEGGPRSILDRIPGARRLKGMFGTAGLVSAGLTATGMAVGRGVNEVTDFRRMLTQRQQAQTLDIMRGKALEGAVRQSGRGLNFTSAGQGVAGGLKGAGYGAAIGAGIGSVVPVVGTGIGAAVGGLAGGLYGGVKGYFAGGEQEAETRALKARPALESLEYARSLRQGRVQAFAGGGVSSSRLTALQEQGANRGFMPEETVNQFTQARQFLGNRSALTALPQLQELQRSVGLETGEGAQATETFTGGGRTTRAQGITKIVETLKKGVAAGLDASKSGQFLKSASDFIQQSAGMGRLDTDKITEDLSRAAFGFARGGQVTDMDLQRAVSHEQQVRQESTANTGIAAIGNIKAIQEAIPGATTGQFMAAQNISAQATPEDVQKILGVDKNTAQKFLQSKGKNLQTGLETAIPGDQALQLAMGAQATGMTTEQFLGRREMEQFQGAMPQGQLPGVSKTAELDSLIKEAATKQTAFVSGIDLMARESLVVAEKLKKVAEDIANSSKYLKDVIGPAAVQVRR